MAEKLAVITGASSGIGAAFAKHLASMHYNLILISKDREKLAGAGKELKDIFKVEIGIIAADLSEPEDLDMLDKKLAAKKVDLLINNAGFGLGKDFCSSEASELMSIMSVHMTATTRLTRLLLPGMIERGHGSIINVSSVAAFGRNRKNSVMYNSTKTYVIAFSETLQKEIDSYGKNIKVQALCPGFTNTDFHKNRIAKGRDFSSVPKWMWMDADDVARLSLSALNKRRVIYVPGLLNKLTVFMFRNRILSWIPNGIMERKH